MLELKEEVSELINLRTITPELDKFPKFADHEI